MKRKLGNMVEVHPLDDANTTDDICHLAETHFKDLVRFVHKRGLIERFTPKKQERFMFHCGFCYRLREHPKLTPLESRMAGLLLGYVEPSLSGLRADCALGRLQDAALSAWNICHDLLTIRISLEFDRDVGRSRNVLHGARGGHAAVHGTRQASENVGQSIK